MFSDLSNAGNYSVIYADPPWSFKTFSDKGHEKAPQKHYSCMDLDAIKAMPVGALGAKNAVCLMWVVNPLLPQGIETLAAWGFTYKTVAFTWVKQNKKAETFFTGLGYYTRANPEICILGTKGKPLPRKSRSIRNLCVSPLREHSRKPDEIVTRIEGLFDGPYVELFGRTTRAGWDVWGNQTDKFETVEAGDAAPSESVDTVPIEV